MDINFEVKELRNLKLSINNIKRAYINIPDIEAEEEFKKKVKGIINYLEKIYEEAFNDSKNIFAIKHHGDIYLPMFISIIEKYNNLKKKNANTREITDFYEKTNLLVKTLLNYYKKKLDSIYENSIIEDDAEIKTLLNTIK